MDVDKDLQGVRMLGLKLPTDPRWVNLAEMDLEEILTDHAYCEQKAATSCISLIRGLGFQSIVSATNDKIQNYLENVDKTFVYANPNKRHISIQEFEKTEFGELAEE